MPRIGEWSTIPPSRLAAWPPTTSPPSASSVVIDPVRCAADSTFWICHVQCLGLSGQVQCGRAPLFLAVARCPSQLLALIPGPLLFTQILEKIGDSFMGHCFPVSIPVSQVHADAVDKYIVNLPAGTLLEERIGDRNVRQPIRLQNRRIHLHDVRMLIYLATAKDLYRLSGVMTECNQVGMNQLLLEKPNKFILLCRSHLAPVLTHDEARHGHEIYVG